MTTTNTGRALAVDTIGLHHAIATFTGLRCNLCYRRSDDKDGTFYPL